jgi:hypothetical protein
MHSKRLCCVRQSALACLLVAIAQVLHSSGVLQTYSGSKQAQRMKCVKAVVRANVRTNVHADEMSMQYFKPVTAIMCIATTITNIAMLETELATTHTITTRCNTASRCTVQAICMILVSIYKHINNCTWTLLPCLLVPPLLVPMCVAVL